MPNHPHEDKPFFLITSWWDQYVNKCRNPTNYSIWAIVDQLFGAHKMATMLRLQKSVQLGWLVNLCQLNSYWQCHKLFFRCSAGIHFIFKLQWSVKTQNKYFWMYKVFLTNTSRSICWQSDWLLILLWRWSVKTQCQY